MKTIVMIGTVVLLLCCLWFRLRCKKRDISWWIRCSACIIKWRPTAYGPATPDDMYCPKCGSNLLSYEFWDPFNTIPEFKE